MGGGTLHLKVLRRRGGGGLKQFRNRGGKGVGGGGGEKLCLLVGSRLRIFAGITH